MKHFMHEETKDVVSISDAFAEGLARLKEWPEVRLSETFQELVKYGEWMPVEGIKDV